MKPAILLSFLLATACAEGMTSARRATIGVRDNAYKVSDRVKSYFTLPPYQEPVPQPPMERYCYSVLQDILCYREPQPAMAARLVGAQAGVNPPAPLLAQSAGIANQIPAVEMRQQRIGGATPVFIDLPPPVKSDEQMPDLSAVEAKSKGTGPLF